MFAKQIKNLMNYLKELPVELTSMCEFFIGLAITIECDVYNRRSA